MTRTKGIQKKQWYMVTTYYRPSITEVEVEIEKEYDKFVVINGRRVRKETRDTLYSTNKKELLEKMVERFRIEMNIAEIQCRHKKEVYQAALKCAKENL